MSQDVRQRRTAPGATVSDKDSTPRNASTRRDDDEDSAVTLLDVVRIVAGLIVINLLLSYFITENSLTWGYNPWWLRPKVLLQSLRPPVVLTDTELLAYTGQDTSLPIYLGLNGTIYDVTAGRRIYGPGGMYAHFAGRDGTRGFITGCFREDGVPDYRGAEWTYVPTDVARFEDRPDETLSAEERTYRAEKLLEAQKLVDETIRGWAKMFRGDTGKDYFEVGKIRRRKRWLDTKPVRPLCEAAERMRPQPQTGSADNAGPRDAGAKYRGD